MLLSVVAIGNSRGVRLPKAILDQLQISDKVDMDVENGFIILKPVPRQTRQGWDEAFQEMSDRSEDRLLIEEEVSEKDFTWEW